MPVQGKAISMRQPRLDDAKSIWSLVRSTHVLDVNACYTYLMLCRNFANTCVVAEVNGEVAGFLTAYICPEQLDTLFVWQIAVKQSERGQGLASGMLNALSQRNLFKNIRYLETTIAPSNTASQALFQKFARQMQTSCHVSSCFEAHHFPDEHERELLFRIGPFRHH